MKFGVEGLRVWREGGPGDETRGAEAEGHKFVIDVPDADYAHAALRQIEDALRREFPPVQGTRDPSITADAEETLEEHSRSSAASGAALLDRDLTGGHHDDH